MCKHGTADTAVSFPPTACQAQKQKTLLHTDREQLGFTLCGLSVESDSDALFHPDSSPICCLTTVMGLFMRTKANPRLLLFLSLWYESLGWCVVGGWNDSVDNICLSDPMGARPWLDAPPLSPYLHLRGQPRTAFFCTAMPLGFRWAFCSLCRHNAGCGLWNNTVFREQGRNCT